MPPSPFRTPPTTPGMKQSPKRYKPIQTYPIHVLVAVLKVVFTTLEVSTCRGTTLSGISLVSSGAWIVRLLSRRQCPRELQTAQSNSVRYTIHSLTSSCRCSRDDFHNEESNITRGSGFVLHRCSVDFDHPRCNSVKILASGDRHLRNRFGLGAVRITLPWRWVQMFYPFVFGETFATSTEHHREPSTVNDE